MPNQQAAVRIDVGRLLDEGRWGPYQQGLVALAALAIIFDGADIQLLGVAIPAMADDWDIERGAFAPALASGLLGMMTGGAIGGLIGDRLGRRLALIGSLVTFAVFTLAVTSVDSLLPLAALRFLAGLGFGATVPNAVALASEYVPLRHRPFAVTLTMVCVPVGGTIAALIASQVLPTSGWRALFAIGGITPLAVAVLLIAVLPESPRYLARHPARWPDLARLLRRAGHDVPDNAVFGEGDEVAARASLGALFVPHLRRDTVALWGAFAFCLMAVYLGFNWIPSMLNGAGLDVAVASTGLAAFNLGGVAGALLAASLIRQIGSRITMIGAAIAAAAGALILSEMPIGPTSARVPIVLMLGFTGGLINTVQIALYALATHVYPTSIRATGIGAATAVGRFGAITSTYLGAWTLTAGGSRFLFTAIGLAMAVVTALLAIVGRHIPVRSGAATRRFIDGRFR